MPLYEYKCDNCGEVFELIQRFSDAPLHVHAKCGGPVHRLISAPALHFKGSGWYITDYAKKGGSEANGSAQESGEKKAGDDTKAAVAESKAEPAKPAPAASSTDKP